MEGPARDPGSGPRATWTRTQGGSFSLHATGAGKALLGALPSARRDTLLDRLELRPYTAHTIVDPAALRRALDEVRERGFAIDDEEFDDGVRCIAVPVGGMDRAIGAMPKSELQKFIDRNL